MYRPSTSQIGAEDAQPERETIIKFVISGPFLDAEAAHTRWSAEPPPTSAMADLLTRIADLERRLDEERALVQMLSRRMPAAPAPEPVETPPDRHQPLVEPAVAVEPALPYMDEPAPACAHEIRAEPATKTIAALPPPPLSTVARTPPPKVRGLRRMIGALRHL